MRSDDRSNRQIARSKSRKAGDVSARIAAMLMKLPETTVKKLELEEGLRDAIDRARAVKSMVARRRAERTLAGDLRRFEIAPIEEQLEKVQSGGSDVQQFHLVEKWRARLIEEEGALTEFPNADEELPRLIAAARRERDTGRPPGSARALFRHLAELLKPPPEVVPVSVEESEASDETDDDSHDED